MSEPNRSERVVAADRRILASVFVVAGAIAVAAMLSAGAQARAQATPSNTSPPTISGTAVSGETLTASLGSWTGTPPISYALAWQRCDAAGASCAAIAGETAQTYVLGGGDIGSTLRVDVTATNAEGSASVQSDQTAVVAAPTVPVNTSEPAISGSPVEGATLTATTGAWTGAGDHLRVPVGALRRGRRASRRLGLPIDPRSHELQLHAHGRRHRAAAPRPGHRVEQCRHGGRGVECDRHRARCRPPRARPAIR